MSAPERQQNILQIKPHIAHQSLCPNCDVAMQVTEILWQGIHVCAKTCCPGCQNQFVEDLAVGQAVHTPYKVDLQNDRLLGNEEVARRWFGEPLRQSLKQPRVEKVSLQIETLRTANSAVILNCLDFLYGHSLLKLLNASTHLREGAALVVLIPAFLRWLVPKEVAEVWTVNLSLSDSQNFYPRLHECIAQECQRFDEIYLSCAYSHPRDFDITQFTGIARHDFRAERFRVTFIWREDRPWLSQDLIRRAARRVKPLRVLLWWQNWRVRRFFSRLRRHYPQAIFTVAGLGTSTQFPGWVDDRRVHRFDEKLERATCQIYSESRLVIGVHGSNLLLPSAHAGMLIDLMPNDRWGHIAQDVLYQSYPDDRRVTEDLRMVSWRYRYLPLDISTKSLSVVAKCMLDGYPIARDFFQAAG